MAHIHEKIDFCIEVFIVYKDKVLLRKHDKYKIWLSVGGHIDLHEDPNEAAIREVKEEVGLDVILYKEDGKQPIFDNSELSIIPPQYMNRHRINDTHEHVALIYFATSENDKLILSETEVADECRWFTKEELLDNKAEISDLIQFYALNALKKLIK